MSAEAEAAAFAGTSVRTAPLASNRGRLYPVAMTIEIPVEVEKDLQDLATIQNRAVSELVEDAVRQYLEAAAITDLNAEEVAETQSALVGELHDIEA